MIISAIIPTRGRIDCLRSALESVRRQVGVATVELVVVDDAASPALPRLPDDVVVVPFATPVGACKARNAGVRAARGDILLFLDDDAELDGPDVLARSLSWFAARPRLAVIGYRQLTSEGEVHWLQPCESQVPARSGLFFSYGCLIRRSAFEQVGGFNELFGYYFEEDELSLKFFAAGFEVIYDPELRVRHHQDPRHRDQTYINRIKTRNNCISISQHFPLPLLPIYFVRRLLQHAHQQGLRLPSMADVAWISRELLQRRDAIRRARRSLGWAVVFGFIKLCRQGREHPEPLERQGA